MLLRIGHRVPNGLADKQMNILFRFQNCALRNFIWESMPAAAEISDILNTLSPALCTRPPFLDRGRMYTLHKSALGAVQQERKILTLKLQPISLQIPRPCAWASVIIEHVPRSSPSHLRRVLVSVVCDYINRISQFLAPILWQGPKGLELKYIINGYPIESITKSAPNEHLQLCTIICVM